MSLRDRARADWIKPQDMVAWQHLLYRKHYNAGSDSYRLHYIAALRGNRISVARMEWLMDAAALARIRGEVPQTR